VCIYEEGGEVEKTNEQGKLETLLSLRKGKTATRKRM